MDGRDIILEEMKKQGKELWQIDVRQVMLDDIFGGKENWKTKISELTKWRRPFFKEKLREDIEKYYSDKTNILAKTAIGKYWADKGLLDYDYDASDFANVVYNMAFFEGKGEIKHSHGYEYVLVVDGVKYRGDTMNSWNRTVNKFIGVYGCDPKNYETQLPDCITSFMNVVYTIGNFIPVPLTPNFNTTRNTLCKDYWDATLLAIYNYYTGEGENSEGWKKLFQYEGIKRWLGQYGKGEDGWRNFVKENFLQDFVCDFDKGDLRPISFKHSTPNNKKPVEECIDKNGEYNPQPQVGANNDLTEFENFFATATDCIRKRGEKIWDKTKDSL